MNKKTNLTTFALGLLIGGLGIPALKTETAKKACRYLFAGAFIARDSVMETVEKIQASAADIAEDAKVITEKYYADKEAAAEAADEEAAE